VGKDWWANEAYPDPGSAATYSISGTVTDAGVNMSGVTVTAGGKSATSAINGSWTISGIPAGTWPVTAWAPNAAFNAVNATVSTANVSGIAVVRTRYSISGRVNATVAGVAITVRAGSYSTAGNSVKVGNKYYYDYTLSVPAGTYTVAASASGYRFTPSTFANPVNASTGNQSGCDFSNTAGASYQIRGVVTVNGLAVSGVTMTTAGASAITGPDGAYVLANLVAGSYTVTPTLSGGTYSPINRSDTIVSADVTAQDFALSDAAPTVATAAAASPTTVATPTGSTSLSGLGADNSGESTLTYTWTTTSGPYPVTFSVNGTNAAKSCIAAFQGAGSYTFRVTIRDIRQQTVTSTVAVTVQSLVSSNLVTVSPYRCEMIFGDTMQYTATAWSSSGTVLASTPVWSTDGGSISTTGLYTATQAGATYTITATALGASGDAYATIIGTGQPTVTVSTTDAIASEPGLGLGNATVTFTRNIGLGAVVINYEAGVTSTATMGADYAALGGTVAMADGQTTATVVVTVLDDAVVEPHETVVINVLNGTGYQIGGSGTVTVTIKDDESNLITVTATDATAAEPAATGGTGTYRLTRTGNPDAAITVNLAMSGTASGADYTGIGSTVTIGAGATYVDVVLTPVNDGVSEVAETAILDVIAGTGYAPGSPASATITILDDDANLATVAVGDADCQEASSNNGTFIITRLGNRAAAITVNYTMSGQATNGTDYVSLVGTVSVAANANTATVTVDPTDDTVYEGSETVILTIAAGTGYTVGSPASASLDLLDNDKPTVSIVATDALADESGATATYTVSRTGITTLGDLVVSYTVTGTAIAGVDYQTLTGTVTVPSGQADATITLTPIQDALTEIPETVIVTLVAQTAYTVAVSPNNAATATITDDTESPVLTITASDSLSSEPSKGDGTGAFTITRAGSPAAALTAGLVISGTATSGSDFSAIAATAVLGSGVTSVVITVSPIDDATAEPDETVIATLQSGTGYTVGATSSATVNLYDDEATQVIVEVSDAQAGEAATPNTGAWILRRLGL
ncbi:MAG: Calx-beta domain-containing protein, partial [Planctomycetota bacterium]